MSDLLIATREKERTCRSNGNDMAADEYKAYADKIEELEAWAIARCNELGTQITRRDKRIKELEAEKEKMFEDWGSQVSDLDSALFDLEEKIKLVELFPKKWRKHSFDNPKAKTFMDAGDCADELQAELEKE